MSDRVYTAEEAADLLHCSVRHLLGGVRDGKFPASKPGRKWVFTQADIDAILNASRKMPVPTVKAGTARQRRRAS